MFIVDQGKIEAYKPHQVYISITQIRHILINHCSYMDCKPNRHNTIYLFYCSN